MTILVFSVLLFISACAAVSNFPRQAPFCVTHKDEPDLRNFQPIFEYYNSNPEKYVPVSPDTFHSPTGYITNITITRIYINSTAFPGMKNDHPYREFHNYFHIHVVATREAEGLEGLYMQAIGAPLGVPFGEFVTDWDCGDCGAHTTSRLAHEIAIVPCAFQPAASYLSPVILSIGGKSDKPTKFFEAHFHFRYVDYPCYDITYAQFLVIAVRKFRGPLQYEVFYSPLYKVNIEGVGAPFPMYYGLAPEEIECHHYKHSYMNNWQAQKNQRAKVKYSAEFDKCTYNENNAEELGEGNICPPGPVTCGTLDRNKVINTGREWQVFRSKYSVDIDSNLGTNILCMDCGEWEDRIGPGKWPRPRVITDLENVSIIEIVITQKPVLFVTSYGADYCDKGKTELRGKFGKRLNGSRDRTKTACPNTYQQEFETKGYKWGYLYVIRLHSVLMLFTWSIGSSCLIYPARFLKEASFAEKGSGCFGIGKWLWEHLFLTYLCIFAMTVGIFVVAYVDLETLCQLYDLDEDTEHCIEDAPLHKLVGTIACLLFFMALITGWTRPKNRLIRDMIIYYHAISGYLAKYVGMFCLLTINRGELYIMSSRNFIIIVEISFILFYIAGTFIQWKMDSQMKFRVRERRALPVPEGIDTFSEPPLKNVRALLFPCLIIFQLLCYVMAAFNIWDSQNIKLL